MTSHSEVSCTALHEALLARSQTTGIKRNGYFYSEISLCHTKTVNYSFSKIKIEKINKLKYWYKSNYMNFKHQFNSDFGFDLKI